MGQSLEYMVRRLAGLDDYSLVMELNRLAKDGWALRTADGARYVFERSNEALPAPAQDIEQPAPTPRPTEWPSALTDRELEVARLVAEGRNNRAIAAVLALREQTVKEHVSRIMGKLDVENRTLLALRFHELFPS